MELSTRLFDQLSLLGHGPVGGGTDLDDDLNALESTLSEAVSGYAGLRLTLVHGDQPVQLTALLPAGSDRTVVTSLRMWLPLPSASGGPAGAGDLVVWSSVPGSLVDLAADVGYILRTGSGAGPHPSSVVLDADLPLSGVRSGVIGLDEFATVSRAAGLLIGQGHDPRSVHDELRRRATEEGLSTSALADRLLKGG